MSKLVSRTVSQIASLATLSLFTTAMVIAVANGKRLRWDGTFCPSHSCVAAAYQSPSLVRHQKPVIAVAASMPARGI
jgi:hypothetical protein